MRGYSKGHTKICREIEVGLIIRALADIWHQLSFQCRNEQFFARSRKSRNYAEAYKWYAAQVIPQIDAEIAEKGHF